MKIYRLVQKVEAQFIDEDGEASVKEEREGDRDEEGVPEPEHQVDLLVDDVLHRIGGNKWKFWETSTCVRMQRPL